MKPWEIFRDGKLYLGNTISVLKELPDESVDMVITSPPYYKLRSYGTDAVIWDENIECDHEWVYTNKEAIPLDLPPTGGVRKKFEPSDENRGKQNPIKIESATCKKCGAWMGELGQEPTPQDFCRHLCDIFDEVKRVLKPHGSCYVNLGDSYSNRGEVNVERWNCKEIANRPASNVKSLSSKCLVQLPSMFALEMTYGRGWTLRNTIIWNKCLYGNTSLIAMKNGHRFFTTIEELYNNYEGVSLPSQDKYGNNIWVPVKNVFYNGKMNTLKVKTRSGREVVCTSNHKFVKKNSSYTKICSNYRKIDVGELKDEDYLLINVNNKFDIDKGDECDYDHGYFVGFFLAEGNYIKRKGKKVGIQLSCGVKDIGRGYIKKIKKYSDIRTYIYNNIVCIRKYSKKIASDISKYIGGETSHDKEIKSEVLNTSISFIRGVMEGFLDGDGSYDNGRWKVGLTLNKRLLVGIESLCRILGWDIRIQNDRVVNGYNTMNFQIRKNLETRTVNFDMITDKIRSIEDNGLSDVYDIELEPIYTGGIGNNQYKRIIQETRQERYLKYNHLYFLSNGLWSHNSNALPSSVKDRFTNSYEYVYFFTKNEKYYFEQQFEPYKSDPHGGQFGSRKGVDEGNQILQNVQYDPDADPNRFYGNPGRNKRDVWVIPTQSSTIPHFAQFPSALLDIPIKASCPKYICKKCGKPREKIYVDVESIPDIPTEPNVEQMNLLKSMGSNADGEYYGTEKKNYESSNAQLPSETKRRILEGLRKEKEERWTDCNCGVGWVPGVVLDPFMGSGTTAKVARELGRRWIGVDISETFLKEAVDKIEGNKRPDGQDVCASLREQGFGPSVDDVDSIWE